MGLVEAMRWFWVMDWFWWLNMVWGRIIGVAGRVKEMVLFW
jgi:hypothetical protein